MIIGKNYVFAFLVLNFVACANLIVYAENCDNRKVRPNSPCLTMHKVCKLLPTNVCTNGGQNVEKGSFQCDSPNNGTTCQGSGVSKACYTECTCKRNGNVCVMDYNTNCTSHNAEELMTVPL